MLVAIISDIHDNIANLEKCLSWCRTNKIEKIICCGDMTTRETAGWLSANFTGEIFVVYGNLEIYNEPDLNAYKNINYCGEIGIIKLAGLNIGICHEPFKIERALESAPENLDFIFYGHTHKPWIEKKGSTTVVNPGNLANVFHQPTFAVLNTVTKKLELKILADL